MKANFKIGSAPEKFNPNVNVWVKLNSGKIVGWRKHPADTHCFFTKETALEWAHQNKNASYESSVLIPTGRTRKVSWPAHRTFDVEYGRGHIGFNGWIEWEAGEAEVPISEEVKTIEVPWWGKLAAEIIRDLG